MKYALLIYTTPDGMDGMTPDELEAMSQEYFAIRDIPGVYAGDQLHPAESATTIRSSGGQTLSTDGPFADTKEILAGYYLMDADDIEAPLAVAAKIPAVRLGGAVEVRPMVGK